MVLGTINIRLRMSIIYIITNLKFKVKCWHYEKSYTKLLRNNHNLLFVVPYFI